MSSTSSKKTIDLLNQMSAKARLSTDYWVTGPIVEFTEDICRLMDEQGVSRAELARRLGTSRAYITKLLGGDANFTLQTMTKISMALGAAVHVHVAPQDATVRWQEGSSSGSKMQADEEALQVDLEELVREP
jgi:transcriptional regulator with XRE-family HTH domain